MEHLTARTVHYRLNAEDVQALDGLLRKPAAEGDKYPAIVTAAAYVDDDGESVLSLDLQVFLGPCTIEATSRRLGDQPGQCTWAQKAHLAGVDYIPTEAKPCR